MLEQDGRDAYLETQVLTATPQKLRLMLIGGALRFAHQALRVWHNEDYGDAFDAVLRCRGIVSELLCSIKAKQSELARTTAGVYVFLFRLLSEAQHHRDERQLRQAIEILEIEQETWRQLCEQMPEAPQRTLDDQVQEVTAGSMPAIAVQDLTGEQTENTTEHFSAQKNERFDSSGFDSPGGPSGFSGFHRNTSFDFTGSDAPASNWGGSPGQASSWEA